MIEQFFRRNAARRRLARSSLASLIEAYVVHLDNRGYSRSTILAYVQAIEHFGRWLRRRGLAVVQVNADVAEVFLTRHVPRCKCRMPRNRTIHVLRAALRQLLVVVRAMGLTSDTRTVPSAIDALVVAFERHLIDTCGAAPATRRYYLREARALLVARPDVAGAIDIVLTAEDVRSFIAVRCRDLQPASTNVVATAIRSFARFLRFEGHTAVGANAVPRAAHWRLAQLPPTLSDAEVTTFLSSFDRTTPLGRRDYAIAMCLAELGLRALEVARLTLDSVDWRSGTITIAPGKCRRSDRLPLPPAVAAAIADYLRHGRPVASTRALFVHHRPPRGQGVGPATVRGAVRRAYARAGLNASLTGTHVLRHTAATRMLRGGASMKQIADVLRHRSIDTTAIYAKVDLGTLARVALPWPEARS